jgi:hypothetical protein
MDRVYGPFLSREQALEVGLKQFYDGRICKRGHRTGRRVSPNCCVECQRIDRTAPPALMMRCEHCGEQFKPQARRRFVRFCSTACNRTFNNRKKSAELRSRHQKEELLMQWLPGYMPRSKAKQLGLRHYFVGTCCCNGHVAPHNVSGGCIVCAKIYSKEWQKENRKKNPNVYRRRDRARVRPRTDEVRQKEAAVRELRRPEIRAYFRQYHAARRAKDIQYKLRCGLHSRISVALRKQYGNKAYKTMELLGCSVAELMLHLEKQFYPGMNWKNHGRNGWHVDHILPCTHFDLTDPDQQKRCFNYTNLQPLWEADNIRKSNSISR